MMGINERTISSDLELLPHIIGTCSSPYILCISAGYIACARGHSPALLLLWIQLFFHLGAFILDNPFLNIIIVFPFFLQINVPLFECV